LSWPATRHLYRHADAIASYGEHVSDYVRRYRADGESVFVAPQAVDVAHFAAPQTTEAVADARRRVGVPGDDLFVLFVGRLEEEKGIDTLLAAWSQADLGAHSHLRLAGRGPLRDRIETAGDRVRALDYLDPSVLPAVYAAADILVLPSVPTATFREPWGLVVNEAMLQRTPVISSDAVGAAAGGLVQNGRTGLVFPAGDAASLAGSLKSLAADPDRRRAMGDAAFQSASRLDSRAWAAGMGAALEHAEGIR
jgi:glycosyltransferase involved in cell wall biosynthesis